MVEPVGPAQAPTVTIVIPGLQETLAQILTMCTSLAQAVSIQTALATSQAGKGTQTPAARTLEQVMQGLQTLGVLHAQPVATAQSQIRGIMRSFHKARACWSRDFHGLRSRCFETRWVLII
nr:uncharacterized protein LOC104107119 [Nicotiana tomentosiformis]